MDDSGFWIAINKYIIDDFICVEQPFHIQQLGGAGQNILN